MGFTAKDVWAMSHLEAGAWLRSYLESQGVKPKVQNDITQTGAIIISRRKPRK